jgi:hypothetical protein
MIRKILMLAASLLCLAAPPTGAQVSTSNVHQAEAAILSAGGKARAVSNLRSVRGVGVVYLRLRTVPTLRSDQPHPAEFAISAQKNRSGVARLRAALAANPATHRALAARRISVNRVVGIDIHSGGAIRLYVL